MFKYFVVMITLISSVGCTGKLLGPGVNETAAKADAAVSVVVAHMEKDGIPDNKPIPGSVCPTCNGTGKTGDGRVSGKCMDCNGTGKVLAEVSAVPEVTAVPVALVYGYDFENIRKSVPGYSKILRVYGGLWCVPCQNFKNDKALIKAINDKGVFVNYIDIDKHPEVNPVQVGSKTMTKMPFFVLEVNGVPVYWFEGAVDLNKL